MIHSRPVVSSMISEVGYDNNARVLRVVFKKGPEWEYDNVPPEEYETLIHASSVGKYFHANIRNQFTGRKIVVEEK